jgi:hypothetical protein
MRDPHNYPLLACKMSLYPTHDSLLEAVQYIEAQAPMKPHEVFPLLMSYHNTLLQEIDRDQIRPGQQHLVCVK